MRRDGKDDQDEQGAQIAAAGQHRKARDAASRQHHAGPEQRAAQQHGRDRELGREKAVRLEGDQARGDRQPGPGNRRRQRHRPGAQRRETIRPLPDQAAAQTQGAALRQRAIGAAEHQTQHDGGRKRGQFLESELLEHGETASFRPHRRTLRLIRASRTAVWLALAKSTVTPTAIRRSVTVRCHAYPQSTRTNRMQRSAVQHQHGCACALQTAPRIPAPDAAKERNAHDRGARRAVIDQP